MPKAPPKGGSGSGSETNPENYTQLLTRINELDKSNKNDIWRASYLAFFGTFIGGISLLVVFFALGSFINSKIYGDRNLDHLSTFERLKKRIPFLKSQELKDQNREPESSIRGYYKSNY